MAVVETWRVLLFIFLLAKIIYASSELSKERRLPSFISPTKKTSMENDKQFSERLNRTIGWHWDGFRPMLLRHALHSNQQDHLELSSRGVSKKSIQSKRSTARYVRFEHSFIKATCEEDVALGTILTNVTLLHEAKYLHPHPSIPDLEVYVDNENFSASWSRNVVTITTKHKLDADFNDGIYHLNLTAHVLFTKEKATARIRIIAKNVNDEPPEFTEQSYNATVNDGSEPNTLITTVQATDNDGDNIVYTFPAGTTRHRIFKINKKKGEIRLHNSINKIGFKQQVYNLEVEATDDGSCCKSIRPQHTTRVPVTIVVIEVNHPPICDVYKAEVKENQPINTTVITLTATDTDRGRNGQLEYSIVPDGSEAANWFKIDPKKGEVKTQKVFDREGVDSKSLTLTVMARDDGEPALEGSCTLQVNVMDVNDNSPQFNTTQYSVIIPQDEIVGDSVFYASASDADADQNAEINYSLGPYDSLDKGYFAVDPDSGLVTIKKPLTKKNFSFHVRATDKGIPPLSTTVPVEIKVMVGDSLPVEWENNQNQQKIIPEISIQPSSINKVCSPGYQFNMNHECVDVDECKQLFPGPCLHGGTCVNFAPFYKCECQEDYTGSLCEGLPEKIDVLYTMGSIAAIAAFFLLMGVLVFHYWRSQRKQEKNNGPEESLKYAPVNQDDGRFSTTDNVVFDSRSHLQMGDSEHLP